MRLTLRTLLAYLDGTLSPQDAAHLETKIQESSYAMELIRRIRTITHEPRMEAPRIDAKTPTGDPNLIAEYLDSTLDLEKVPALERALLESDASLAEVASCHKILSQVLQQPAKVPSRLRKNLYGLESRALPGSDQQPGTQRLDAPHSNAETSPDAADEEEFVDAVRLPTAKVPVLKPKTGRQSRKPKPSTEAPLALPPIDSPASEEPATEVISQTLSPTWVDQHKSRSAVVPAIVMVGSLLALVTVALLAATGTLQSWLGGGQSTASGPLHNEEPLTDQPLDPSIAASATLPTSQADETSESSSVAEASQTENQPNESNAGDGLLATDIEPGDSRSATPVETTDNSVVDPIDTQPMIATTSEDPRDPTSSAFDASLFPFVAQTDPDTLVAWRPGSSDAWSWSGTEAQPIPFQVVNLGVFRSTWSWDSSPDVTLINSSDVEFTVIDAGQLSSEYQPTTGIVLRRGQLIIDAVDRPGRSVVVRLGDRTMRLTLLDPDSLVALERVAYLPPGSDPVNSKRLWIDHVIGVRGKVNLEDSSGVRTFEPNTAMTWHDGVQHRAGPIASLPQWVTDTDQLEEMAATQLRRRIDPASASVDDLRALTEDVRPEVRIPSAECLAELGDLEPLFAMLDDERNRTNWRRRMLELIEQQMVGDRVAAQAWQDFLLTQGDVGQLALRLLTGFSAEQLEAGEAVLMVDSLDNPSLLIRSLAIQQLMRITGTSELYLPDGSPRDRARRVQAWRGRLGARAIYYATAPEPPALAFEP